MGTVVVPTKSQGGYSPLRDLATKALQEVGDLSSDRVDGDTLFSLIDHANMTLETIMVNPYWEGGVIKYYLSLDETRQVPDLIMKYGMMAYYSDDQASKKAPRLMKKFLTLTSQLLYRLKFGEGRVTHERVVIDKDKDGYINWPVDTWPVDDTEQVTDGST